jgi:hypothetical protein
VKVVAASQTRPDDVPRSEPRSGAAHAAGPPPVLPRAAAPWKIRETAVAVVVGAIGVLGVGWCWYESSDELNWRDQLGWLAGGAPFAALTVFAGVCWVALGMRRVRSGFQALAAARATAFAPVQPRTELSMQAVLAATPGLVTSESMTRAHRPDCLLMRGKQPIEIPVGDEPRYVRCGVCGW